jgi:pimeloyl-ACP methyl ester carboxylesterase
VTPPARLLRVPADGGAELAVEVHDPAAGAAADAPLVVLAHGFPAARWLWAGVLPRLAAAGWRAAAPDLRGFGGSTLGAAAGPPSLDRHADDLARVLDALGAPRAVVGGLSMGGYATLAFWRRHAGRARALVLADTRAAADTAEARARRDELVAVARAQGGGAVAATQVDAALGRSTRAGAPERVVEFRRRLGDPDAAAVADALLAMRDRPDTTPLLAGITVPTLVIGGAEDAITPPATLRALAAAIPGARLTLVDGAGHASAWERPDAFAEALLAFLAALPPAAAPRG